MNSFFFVCHIYRSSSNGERTDLCFRMNLQKERSILPFLLEISIFVVKLFQFMIIVMTNLFPSTQRNHSTCCWWYDHSIHHYNNSINETDSSIMLPNIIDSFGFDSNFIWIIPHITIYFSFVVVVWFLDLVEI